MVLVPPSQVRNVTGLTEQQKEKICDFLQGAAYCWSKNRPKEDWFSLRSLMGGENYFWAGTPMLPLWEKHDGVSSDPVKAAGQDGGWLLKKVLSEDVRTFETREGAFIREYRWVSKAGVPREQ